MLENLRTGSVVVIHEFMIPVGYWYWYGAKYIAYQMLFYLSIASLKYFDTDNNLK